MSYRISVKAAEDIEHIWVYTFEHWSLEQADRYVNLIFDEIEYLAEHPASGRDLQHIRKNYRCSKVKSHIVFYRQNDQRSEIEVIRVLHQSMDTERHLDE